MGTIFAVLKVLFRNGEQLINIIQQIYAEMNSNSPESKELGEMEKEILDDESQV